MANALYDFKPSALLPLETNKPRWELFDAGTILVPNWRFDDTTEEYLNGTLTVHEDVDTSGTATFQANVSVVSAATSDNVGLRFGHRPVATTEAIDGAYTNESADDQAIQDAVANLTIITWTETLTNLGWLANELVYFRFSRFSATTNNLAGDMRLHHFSIRLPLT